MESMLAAATGALPELIGEALTPSCVHRPSPAPGRPLWPPRLIGGKVVWRDVPPSVCGEPPRVNDSPPPERGEQLEEDRETLTSVAEEEDQALGHQAASQPLKAPGRRSPPRRGRLDEEPPAVRRE